MNVRLIRTSLSIMMLLPLLAGFAGASQATQPETTVVSIWAGTDGRCEESGTGTGFFISSDGYILTAAHVVDRFQIGETAPAQWAPPQQTPRPLTAQIHQKPRTEEEKASTGDAALLKVREEGPFPWLSLGDSDRIAIGEESVTVIGFPEPQSLGCITPTVTSGQITARKPPGEVGPFEALQISVAPVRPGSSGSPVINAAGKVIGVLFAGTGIPGPGQDLPFYFAVPINLAKHAFLQPEILDIRFRREIPADGSKVIGTIIFRDIDGDINLASFEVVEAVDFEPFTFNPKEAPSFDQRDSTGHFSFYIFCRIPQRVTLRATLEDEAGNTSEPEEFTFECKS